MVRHGQARNNVEKLLAGRMEGIELTIEGRQQAKQAAEMISQINEAKGGNGISAIYSSPLQRAADTAKIISEGCGVSVETEERLIEIDMGKFTGMRFEEVAASHGDIFTKFYEGDVGIAHQGVETFDQVRRRVLEFVSWLGGQKKGSDSDSMITIVVTHLDPIKAVLGQTINVSSERLLSMEIANAALNVFDISDDGNSSSSVSLVALNVMNAARFA